MDQKMLSKLWSRLAQFLISGQSSIRFECVVWNSNIEWSLLISHNLQFWSVLISSLTAYKFCAKNLKLSYGLWWHLTLLSKVGKLIWLVAFLCFGKLSPLHTLQDKGNFDTIGTILYLFFVIVIVTVIVLYAMFIL